MRDSSYFPRSSRPGPVRREIQRNRRDQQKQGPPKPPAKKGPELRRPDGTLERALVQNKPRFKKCLGCPTPRRCTAAGKCLRAGMK